MEAGGAERSFIRTKAEKLNAAAEEVKNPLARTWSSWLT